LKNDETNRKADQSSAGKGVSVPPPSPGPLTLDALGAPPGKQGAAVPTPALPTLSMIQNKNLEEIIAKFSAALDDHVSAFHSQAKDIALWDTMLIAQGEKVREMRRGGLMFATVFASRLLMSAASWRITMRAWSHWKKRKKRSTSS
jgi:hypothetical protein